MGIELWEDDLSFQNPGQGNVFEVLFRNLNTVGFLRILCERAGENWPGGRKVGLRGGASCSIF